MRQVFLRQRRVARGSLKVKTIAIVGCGPTSLYVLKALAASAAPLRIEVFEAGDEPGAGMPYGAAQNADFMLCNAYSQEIPPLTTTLVDWLSRRTPRDLGAWALTRSDISARAFYPRVLIGEYLRWELDALCARARRAGHRVRVRSRCAVEDVVPQEDGVLVCARGDGGAFRLEADDAIVATGHRWPTAPAIDGVPLRSPWPARTLADLPAGRIGVLGSSLSAIDILVALGHAHGTFEERGGAVAWRPHPGREGLKVTMVSRSGVMPEADFHYPFPYEPLLHLTGAAVDAETARGGEGLLDRVFALLLRELEAQAPGWLDGLGEGARTLEGFASAAFARRRASDAGAAMRRDLMEARRTMDRQETVAHRYALLRAHEAFDRALRHLTDADHARFARHLLPVFADCYAAVPHLSVERVLALFEAGAAELVPCDEARFETAGGGVRVTVGDRTLEFEAMIDARGQAPAPVADLPFRGLVAALEDGRPVAAPFRLPLRGAGMGRVYCLAMPQLLERHPFSQGLANVAALAEQAVEDLLAPEAGGFGTPVAANDPLAPARRPAA